MITTILTYVLTTLVGMLIGFLAKSLTKKSRKEKAQYKALVALLRHEIVNVYVQHKELKTIPFFLKESVLIIYEVYSKYMLIPFPFFCAHGQMHSTNHLRLNYQ